MSATRHSREQGQATTETMLLTWIIVIFVAAVYQLFMTNQTLYRTLTIVHREMFQQAFDANRADLHYAGDDNHGWHTNVILNPTTIPEVRVPLFGVFAQYASQSRLAQHQQAVYPQGVVFDEAGVLRMWSNSPVVLSPSGVLSDDDPSLCGGEIFPPCKRVKAASGTYLNLFEAFGEIIGNAGELIDALGQHGLTIEQLEHWLESELGTATDNVGGVEEKKEELAERCALCQKVPLTCHADLPDVCKELGYW
jgi:hypothetical protein